MAYSNVFPKGYLRRVEDVDETSTNFRQLFTFLGGTLSSHHSYLRRHADWLNEVAIGVIELAQERILEVSDLQQCQNLLFEMLINVTTHGMPKLDLEVGGWEMYEAWDELLNQEREAFEQAQEN